MKRYPKYKDSGVEWIGEIPENWGLPKLKHLISDSFGGEVIDKSFWGEGEETLYTTSKNIHKSDYTGFNNERRTTTDDLLLSRNGDGIVHIPPKGCIYTNVVQLVRIKNKIDRRFLWYSLTFQIKPLNSFSNGDFIVSLNKEQWFNLLTPLPTFEVQHQIVSYLDRKTEGIDKLIQTKERKIELLKEYRTSLISKVVTKGLNPNVKMKDSGVEWIGEIPEHWGTIKLKFQGEVIIGLSYSPDNVVDERDGTTLVMRSSNVQNGKTSFHDNVFVNSDIPDKLRTRENDILICSRNGSRNLIGKNCLIPKENEDLTWGVFMTVYRSKSPKFIYWLLNSPVFESQSGLFLTSTINQLTVSNLENMVVPFVSDINEQNQIVSYLDEQTQLIDKNIQTEERKIELLKEYRQSLISEVVTGKINVSNDEEVH